MHKNLHKIKLEDPSKVEDWLLNSIEIGDLLTIKASLPVICVWLFETFGVKAETGFQNETVMFLGYGFDNTAPWVHQTKHLKVMHDSKLYYIRISDYRIKGVEFTITKTGL